MKESSPPSSWDMVLLVIANAGAATSILSLMSYVYLRGKGAFYKIPGMYLVVDVQMPLAVITAVVIIGIVFFINLIKENLKSQIVNTFKRISKHGVKRLWVHKCGIKKLGIELTLIIFHFGMACCIFYLLIELHELFIHMEGVGNAISRPILALAVLLETLLLLIISNITSYLYFKFIKHIEQSNKKKYSIYIQTIIIFAVFILSITICYDYGFENSKKVKRHTMIQSGIEIAIDNGYPTSLDEGAEGYVVLSANKSFLYVVPCTYNSSELVINRSQYAIIPNINNGMIRKSFNKIYFYDEYSRKVKEEANKSKNNTTSVFYPFVEKYINL